MSCLSMAFSPLQVCKYVLENCVVLFTLVLEGCFHLWELFLQLSDEVKAGLVGVCYILATPMDGRESGRSA